jgi:hypothetical protein
MDRRGHAMQGMDRVYMHVTMAMRERLCDALQELWQTALAQRYAVSSQSAVPQLNRALSAQRRRTA